MKMELIIKASSSRFLQSQGTSVSIANLYGLLTIQLSLQYYISRGLMQNALQDNTNRYLHSDFHDNTKPLCGGR